MSNPKGDREFMYDGNNVPKIPACLIHPTQKSISTRKMEKKFGPLEGVWYGLCGQCIARLKRDRSYQHTIENEIEMRVKHLNEQGEKNDTNDRSDSSLS